MASSQMQYQLLQEQAVAHDYPQEHVGFAMRCFEICFSLLALFFLWPLILMQWTWIRLGTPGPGLFRQQRLGRGAECFSFFKLRTMYVDARQRWPELYAYDYSPTELEELHFKVERDPRVTPQGLWLRASSLDELPNFWNVIKGDMALVGPRPEIPEMLPYYSGDMLLKFSVRPGITGLAQVSGRGRLSFFKTVEYDLGYVRKRSFLFDLRIIWLTLVKMICRDGAF
jgi:lipopolysaccharide/colanic/teichoic acid biosynthesis glycosyltransferase